MSFSKNVDKMAVNTNGGKEHGMAFSITLYNCSFPYATSLKGALVASSDGRLCFITGKGVHILQPKSAFPDFLLPLKFSLGFLTNPTTEDAYDVSINPEMFCLHPPKFEESYAFVFDRTLNPNKGNLAPPFYIDAAWSPADCSADGSCHLAVLASNNHVYYIKKEAHTNSYVIKLDFTQQLYEHYKTNFFNDETVKENVEKHNLSEEFARYRKRLYTCAITGIKWCPCVFSYQTCKEMSTDGSLNQHAFALLCGCNKLGMLVFWKLEVNFTNDELDAEVLRSIAAGNEQATTIEWHQDSPSSTGYIAVAFCNGLISICVIKTSVHNDAVEIKESQKLELWKENDLMQVRFMQWINKDGRLYLIATKQSNIIVFSLEVDKHGDISSHSFSIAPSSHDTPIVALCCHGDSVLTTGEDGNTQHWRLEKDDYTIIKSLCKPGFSSFGMQLSKDGLIMFHAICPTSIIYIQARVPENLELVATPLKSLDTITKRVNNEEKPVDFEWYEVCRVVTNQLYMHPVLKDYASSPLDQSMSTVQLQRKAFLNWLLKRRQNNSESVESPLESPEFNIILQRTVLERVKYAIVFLKDGGELDENSRILTLLAADWLTLKGNQAEFENAISIYNLLKEPDSHTQAEAIRDSRFKSSKTKAEAHSESHSGTTEMRMPARELCPVCKSKVQLEEEANGRCEKGHTWKRCLLTLLILTELQYRKCIYCRRTASSRSNNKSKTASLYCKFVNVNKCCFCNSRLLLCD